jgi:translation initiation factor IF-1
MRFFILYFKLTHESKFYSFFSEMNKKSITARLPGASRHLINIELDEKVFSWFNELRKKKQRVTIRMIQNKAKDWIIPYNI